MLIIITFLYNKFLSNLQKSIKVKEVGAQFGSQVFNLMKRNILITGGAGFIGSHVVRLFVNKYPEYQIINLDALTNAGNLENLKDIEQLPNYHFIKANILKAESCCR